MNVGTKLMKKQNKDLIVLELDSRSDMSLIDPLSLIATIPIIMNNVGCCGNDVPVC